MSGPIQMLSSHRTTTRVDFKCKDTLFFLIPMPKKIRFDVKIQKIKCIYGVNLDSASLEWRLL